jgi:hypothetical protein
VKDFSSSGSTSSEGSNKSRACDVCELDRLLKERSNELRAVLQNMVPTDDGWESMWQALVYVDSTRRMLREPADA